MAIGLLQNLGKQARVGKADSEELLFEAQRLGDGQIFFYFVDKCLPFGAGESCQIYQRVSNALAWAVKKQTGRPNVNYLDDFLFADLGNKNCNRQISIFVSTCPTVGFPVSLSKTEWSAEFQIFLGLLLHGRLQLIGIPVQKIECAMSLIGHFRLKRKAQIRQFM